MTTVRSEIRIAIHSSGSSIVEPRSSPNCRFKCVPVCGCRQVSWRHPVARFWLSGSLGYYAGKRYIPRIWRDFLGFLAVESETDELRSVPTLSAVEECEAAIEIPAAHTDSIAIRIENDDRRHDYVDPPWFYSFTGFGFPQPETISNQRRVRKNSAKRHMAVLLDYGRKNALLCAPCAFKDRAGIHFVPGCKVAGDRIAA